MRRSREILYWFRVTRVPDGGAPLHVREQWIGTMLPVRRARPIEGPESYVGRDVRDRRVKHVIADGVSVEPEDALRALRWFDRSYVAAWWADLLAARPRTSSFVFRRDEGDLLPARMAYMLEPSLQNFDADQEQS
jgi:hypothetical protein